MAFAAQAKARAAADLAADIADQAAEHYAKAEAEGKPPGLFMPNTVSMSAVARRNPNRQLSPEELAEAFPDVDPGVEPLGNMVLVMLRQPLLSSGGIILRDEVRKTEWDNQQVAKVIALGPLAYRDRTTFNHWPEGPWCSVGDYVRVPKYRAIASRSTTSAATSSTIG